MTVLKLVTHSLSGLEVVEIFDDRGDLLGCIYPHREGVHIVSKHFAEEPIMRSVGMVPVPGYLIRLNAQSTNPE
ncbi:hypothetical protein ABIF78_007759 [Bradyrhizobium japonicum]